MAHVFIVNEKTLSIHLKYLFAGTGAKNLDCKFLNNNNVEIDSKSIPERLLVGMIADISRVKKGDSVLFYLQQTQKHEGMFFGSFKVKNNPFLSNDDYLIDELEKKLTFRVELEPNEVYSKGITERECLDSLEGINHPSDLCWSLIYRKLKANRGCTMITDYEYKNIMNKIKKRNNFLKFTADAYDYDPNKNEIISGEKNYIYNGHKESLNVKDRLIYKKNKKNAYEIHLQAYILQNIFNIPELKVTNDQITWIGNEVSCGVGMQSIDILFIQENDNTVNIIICELKGKQPDSTIEYQISKYVEWIKDYIVPTYNKKVILHPTIIAPKPRKKTKKIITEIKDKNVFKNEKLEIKSIRYLSFELQDSDLIFEEVEYE